jgi:acylphosphatase
MICKTVHFSGHVQGVGFRYTAQNIAQRHKVTGYVRNLPDGRVELVAEGEEDEADRFIKAIQSEMEGHIRKTNVQVSPATGKFSGFAIRH